MFFHSIKGRAVMAALVALFVFASSASSLAQNIDTAAIKALVGGRKDTAKSKMKPYKEVVTAAARTSRGILE